VLNRTVEDTVQALGKELAQIQNRVTALRRFATASARAEAVKTIEELEHDRELIEAQLARLAKRFSTGTVAGLSDLGSPGRSHS
jgi:hypothetical protein